MKTKILVTSFSVSPQLLNCMTRPLWKWWEKSLQSSLTCTKSMIQTCLLHWVQLVTMQHAPPMQITICHPAPKTPFLSLHHGALLHGPCHLKVPEFSHDIELVLAEANKSYYATGTHFWDASVKSAIMQDLAKAVFFYTAYPSSLQIASVAEALIDNFPCPKKPRSFLGMYGWQHHLKYKMHNYCAKLRSRKYAYP